MKHMPQMRLPRLNPQLINFARSINCCWLGHVPVTPKPHCKEWDCHNNSLRYISLYGGERLLGYYFLKEVATENLVAILHSVVRRENGQLIDITPFDDERPINMFAILKNQEPNYDVQEIWSHR